MQAVEQVGANWGVGGAIGASTQDHRAAGCCPTVRPQNAVLLEGVGRAGLRPAHYDVGAAMANGQRGGGGVFDRHREAANAVVVAAIGCRGAATC